MLSDDEDSQEQLRAQNVALVRRVLELEQQLALVAQQLAQHRAEAAASVLGTRIKQLEQSEERFRIIAEHSTELISLHDSSGHRLYIAPSVEEVLGYSTDELEKVSNYSLMPQEDRLQG
ncbi:MAG TPA: PAS domain S-box protein, partial [Pseudomonadota bacterium]|nr:PAS domain S-box protein [Pseudomonadota bacterium]